MPKTVIQTVDGKTVELKATFEKRYIYDDLLNCYYDPQTNEYFQEV